MNPVCFPFTDDTGKEMRDLMSQQTELLAAIAAGNASAEFIDASFGALLDGTNTTKVFWLWWPLSATGGASKYDRLCRFFAMMAKAGYKLAYTLRFYLDTVSSDYTGTPLDDLADGRSAAPLVTDTTTDVTDWAEEDLMTWYIRGNALSLADGTLNILALEGEREFDITGETAPVYCFSLALCLKEWEDASYMYNSWRTYPGNGYVPMAGDVAPDGTMRVMTWHPAYCGGLNTKGGMTSGIGKPPMVWVSANAGIPLARKTTTYEGLWNDCDQQFALSAWRLRHWTKSNSGKLEGCTSYNYQYTPAVAEANVKRVVLTTAQAANILPGSGVCLGERVSATQRGSRPLHNPVSNIPYGVVQRRSAAFNSPSSAGLYAPWRSGNLNDNGACGIPCANGNNSPANSNWNGSPRHADENKVRTMRAKALYRACGFDR